VPSPVVQGASRVAPLELIAGYQPSAVLSTWTPSRIGASITAPMETVTCCATADQRPPTHYAGGVPSALEESLSSAGPCTADATTCWPVRRPEAINGRLEVVLRSAAGFQNLTHCRFCSILRRGNLIQQINGLKNRRSPKHTWRSNPATPGGFAVTGHVPTTKLCTRQQARIRQAIPALAVAGLASPLRCNAHLLCSRIPSFRARNV
jgi:hypothetical protein